MNDVQSIYKISFDIYKANLKVNKTNLVEDNNTMVIAIDKSQVHITHHQTPQTLLDSLYKIRKTQRD